MAEEKLETERRLHHSQRLEGLGVLAAGIAHDFNNLLAIITANLDLVNNTLPPASATRRRVDQALLASGRAADLTKQMLAYAGKGRFVMGELDLNKVITENVSFLKTTMSGRISFVLELCDEAFLRGSRVEQEHVEEKSRPGLNVWIEVTDDGCGMSQSTLARLFDPFFSTKFLGRGLGMSTVLGIVKSHDGAILVDDEQGRGTTIRVFFPPMSEKKRGE
jgi:two-component system, cell cycle sensor histidine kinase and response regulator CckA